MHAYMHICGCYLVIIALERDRIGRGAHGILGNVLVAVLDVGAGVTYIGHVVAIEERAVPVFDDQRPPTPFTSVVHLAHHLAIQTKTVASMHAH